MGSAKLLAYNTLPIRVCQELISKFFKKSENIFGEWAKGFEHSVNSPGRPCIQAVFLVKYKRSNQKRG